MIARKHRHRILMSALYEVTLHAQATITHQSIYPSTVIASRSLFKGRDALVTVSQLVGSLLFLHGNFVTLLCISIITTLTIIFLWQFRILWLFSAKHLLAKRSMNQSLFTCGMFQCFSFQWCQWWMLIFTVSKVKCWERLLSIFYRSVKAPWKTFAYFVTYLSALHLQTASVSRNRSPNVA